MGTRKKHTKVTLIILALLLPNLASAEKPLWELAVGVGGVNQSYYTGTKQKRNVVFPVLFPVYRGERFKSDDDGIRAEIIKNPRYKLDLSFDFNFSADSDDIDLRQGMEDIGSLFQIGPSLEITLQQDERQWLRANLPIRFASTIDDTSLDYEGYNFSPGVSYFRYFSIAQKPWRLGLFSNVQFGSADYHDIYYGVDERFATTNRASYTTNSGYSGYRFTASLSSKSTQQLFVFFTRYDNISDAVFNDSPLVETNKNLSAGFLYAYYILKSRKTVSD